MSRAKKGMLAAAILLLLYFGSFVAVGRWEHHDYFDGVERPPSTVVYSYNPSGHYALYCLYWPVHKGLALCDVAASYPDPEGDQN